MQTHASGSGNTFYIRPVALQPDDYQIVAKRLHEVLSNSASASSVPDSAQEKSISATEAHHAVDVSGIWHVHVAYTAGPAKRHTFILSQDRQGELSGIHTGSIGEASVSGSVHGQIVTLRSELPSPGGPLPYVFTGALSAATEDGLRLEGRLECPAQAATAPTGGAAEASGEARWYAVRDADGDTRHRL